MVSRPVLTKRDFTRRYRKLEFGNTSPTWNTPKELVESGYTGKVHLRNRTAGGKTYYNLDPRQAAWKWQSLKVDQWYCSGMAPHHKNRLQGEVAYTWRGTLELLYSTKPKLPMRDALATSSQYAEGLTALALIEWAMNPVSYDWFHILLNHYPGHTIEFSAFDVNWGVLPWYNVCFWEVRAY